MLVQIIHSICHRYGIWDEMGNVYVVTSHQFRHNGITDHLAAGFTAAQIAEITGHHGDVMKNLRTHRVRGGICSDITNCKSDM